MAKVSFVPGEVETRVIQEERFELDLSRDEAEAIVFILRKVGGNPHTTARKHTEAVLDALVDAGVSMNANGKMVEKGRDSIYFTNDRAKAEYPYGKD